MAYWMACEPHVRLASLQALASERASLSDSLLPSLVARREARASQSRKTRALDCGEVKFRGAHRDGADLLWRLLCKRPLATVTASRTARPRESA